MTTKEMTHWMDAIQSVSLEEADSEAKDFYEDWWYQLHDECMYHAD